MDLPTYSAVFSFEKRLYAIYDFELPVPVSLFQMAAFAVALLVTVVLAGGVMEVELTPGSAYVFVVPPAFAAFLASRPLADGRRPHHWVTSQARYLGEPRILVRLRPERAGRHRGEWVPPLHRPRGAALVATGPAVQEPGGLADQQVHRAVGETALGETK